jgi:hypothetical protein
MRESGELLGGARSGELASLGEALEGPRLDLAHPLARQPELLANLLQRIHLAVA